MPDPQVKLFDYDKIEIGEELGSYEYTLTQEMLDSFRRSIDDPGRGVPDTGSQARRHGLCHGLR